MRNAIRKALASLVMVAWPVAMAAAAGSLPTETAPIDTASLQAALLAAPQLNVTGELFYRQPAYAPTHVLYDKFSLKFDRATGRLRLSYSRIGAPLVPRVQIEAWGKLDCIESLRKDYSGDEIYSAKLRHCVKLDDLYSIMSEGAGAPRAPVYVLEAEVGGNVFRRLSMPSQNASIEAGQRNAIVRITDTRVPGYALSYWLSSRRDALEHVEIRESVSLTRATFHHAATPVADGEFVYAPDPAAAAIAEFNGGRGSGEARLRALADNGSRAAKAALLGSRIPPGVMMGVVDDDGWEAMDALRKLGVASMGTMQGQILGRMPERALPSRLASWSVAQRRQRATELILEAARACDGQALLELEQGTDILIVTPQLFQEFPVIKTRCRTQTVPPAVSEAASKFTDPWP